MRLLGVVRLSRDAEESTSVERQRKEVTEYAASHGHTIIGWAEDVDVSGAVSPFERPGLGPWLTEEAASRYDVLAAYKLDRLSRRLFDTFDLLRWAEDHGIVVATVRDSVDLSSSIGRAVIAMIAAVAENELAAIRERSRNARKWQRENGLFHGGKEPYGYKAVRASDGRGWRLEICPETSLIVKRIVFEVLEDKSTNSIAQRLNDESIPTPRDYAAIKRGRQPKGAKWTDTTLRRILNSRALLGQAEHNGEVVYGDDGLPIQRAEPLISRDEWDQLQLVLQSRERAKYQPARERVLSGVAYCECGEPLWCHQMTKYNRKQDYAYYRCAGRTRKRTGCPVKAIRVELIEELAVGGFLDFVGNLEVIERVFVPGVNHEREIRDAEEALADLIDKTAGKPAAVQKVYAEKIKALEQRLATLSDAPTTEDRWEERPSGITYRQQWEALRTTEERRKALLVAGVRVILHEKPVRTRSMFSGLPDHIGDRVSVVLPSDLSRRIQGLSS